MVEEQKRRGKGTVLLALGALGIGILAFSQSVKAQPSECTGNRTEERLSDVICGDNGRGRIWQTRQIICVNGVEAALNWEDIGCVDSDICTDLDIIRETRIIPCGWNDRGEQLQSRVMECMGGQWSEFSDWQDSEACFDPDECLDGTAVNCGDNNNGTQICLDGQYQGCVIADLKVIIDGEIVESWYVAEIGQSIMLKWRSFNVTPDSHAYLRIKTVDTRGIVIADMESEVPLDNATHQEPLDRLVGDVAYPITTTYTFRFIESVYGIVSRDEITIQVRE